MSLTEGGRIAVRYNEVQSAIGFSANPLIADEIFEVCLLALAPHLAGTLCIGVTSVLPNNTLNTLPADCCYITGNELHFEKKIIQHFAPSLNWLRVGDRVGLLRTQESGLKAFINGEELLLNFPTLTDTLYVIIDLRGSCCSLSVTSRKAICSPMTSVRLQDSLEIVLEQEPISLEAPIASEELVSIQEPCTSSAQYEIHDNHGRNIEVFDDKIAARRVASYNQGIVIVQPAMQLNNMIRVKVEQLDMRWQSSLIVGVICGSPDRINLPVTALSIKSPCCIVANDYVSINGNKVIINLFDSLCKSSFSLLSSSSKTYFYFTLSWSLLEVSCNHLLIEV